MARKDQHRLVERGRGSVRNGKRSARPATRSTGSKRPNIGKTDWGELKMSNKNDPKGYYALLGVSPSATEGEIKAAYRRLAKYLHPDVNAADGSQAKFQAVNEAYAVLSDSKRRADYDASWYTSEEHQRPAPDLEPICCSTCGKA